MPPQTQSGTTTSTVPMFAPDGTLGDVPSDRVSEALSRGFKQGINVISKDGQRGTIPAERLQDAVKQGIVPEGAVSQQSSTNAGKNTPPDSFVGGLASRAIDTVSGLARTFDPRQAFSALGQGDVAGAIANTPIYRMAHGMVEAEKAAGPQAAQQFKTAASPGLDIPTRLLTGAQAVITGASMIDPFATPSVANINTLNAQGRPATAAGQGAFDIGALLATGGGKKGVQSIQAASSPVTRETAIANLRQAVNPAATDAGYLPAGANHGTGFAGGVADQINTIVQNGQKTGLPAQLAQAKSPGQALSMTAENIRSAAAADPYYKTFIEPNLKEVFPTTQIKGYEGGTVGEGGNSATLAQLNSRLTTINKTLAPQYSKGGAGSVAAQNAIGADRVVAMQAEAAGIRQAIADGLSRKTGIPSDVISGMRKNWGQLSDIADTVQYRASETLQKEFAEKNKPYSARIPEELTATSAALKGGAKLVDFFAGDPIRNALLSAFKMGLP